MIIHGNFKDVPIEHEFKVGSIKAIKVDESHGQIKFACGKEEIRYFYPTLWVEYNPVDPYLCQTDMHLY